MHTQQKSHHITSNFNNINSMRISEILRTKTENFTVKTFTFKDKLCAKATPGQFVMVWIPGVDEIPISLSEITTQGLTSITVNTVGEASKRLNQKKEGDMFGIRGPFGNGFIPSKGNVMIVGGGTGLGPMMPLAEKLVEIAHRITFMSGVKCKNNLLFLERIKKLLSGVDSETVFTTEDGSFGFEGFVVDYVKQKLDTEHFDVIYTCGPEQMMYKTFLLAEQHDVPVQASLERIMRCGIGLCGSCTIGEFRVCKDGPVLNSTQLRKLDEFGKVHLDFTGKKIRF